MKAYLTCLSILIPFILLSQQRIDITHFDIGQGDATLITSHISEDSIITVLFDAGGYNSLSGEDAGAIINEVLLNQNIRRIDYLVVSHYDADHIGGIINKGFRNLYQTSFIIGPDNKPNTKDDIKVTKVIDRGSEREPSSKIYALYRAFTQRVLRDSIKTAQDLKKGYEIPLGNNAKMTCLATNGFVLGRDARVQFANTENERSLCFLLEFKDFDYLISGDMIGRKAGAENARVEEVVGAFLKRKNQNIDVYHANHHGANNGSETNFLTAIEAEVAIISCGDDNSHHHPTLGSLNRMIDAGIDFIFQTNVGNTRDEVPLFVQERQKVFDGHVVIHTDGESYQIYKYGYANLNGYFYEFNCDE